MKKELSGHLELRLREYDLTKPADPASANPWIPDCTGMTARVGTGQPDSGIHSTGVLH